MLGAARGLIVTTHINAIEGFVARTLGFSLFPKDIYYLDRVPVDKDPFTSAVFICLARAGDQPAGERVPGGEGGAARPGGGAAL